MSNAELKDEGNGQFALQGMLDFDSVPALLDASRGCFDGHSTVMVDLVGVSKINSAGMALLLEWRAWSKTSGQALQLSNLPDSLRQIARVCDVENLLDNTVSG